MLWTLARLLPAVQHPSLEGLPCAEEEVGPEFPARRGIARDVVVADAQGLIAQPEKLPTTSEEVRDFYASTAHYTVRGQAHFTWWARLGARWARRWLDGWRQLQLPLDGRLDLPDRFVGVGGERWWVRGDASITMYCARFDLVDHPAGAHLRVVFPLPGGAFVGLLRGHDEAGQLVWSHDGGDTGLFLVPTGGVARRLPLLRETITLAPIRGGVAVRQVLTLAGWQVLRFLFLCERRRGG